MSLLLRHGERNHITPQDADYGAHVRLTEIGKAQALAAGSMIPKTGTSSYVSSPVMRCCETASQIALGHEDLKFIVPEEIPTDNRLGEFFIKDYNAYTKALDEGFYESICQYLKDGSHPAYKDIDTGSMEMLELVREYSTANWNFILTHDAWIVPCLKHFCQMDFTPQKWMNFLTGIGFIFTDNGYRALPVTCLDSGHIFF